MAALGAIWTRRSGRRLLALTLMIAGQLLASSAWAGFCTGKQNGLWCDGNNLVNCKSGAVASSQGCSAGCVSMPTGVPDKCASASGPCSGKQNGLWCDGDKLLNCQSGAVASSQSCSYGCQSMPAGTNDVCKAAPAPSGPCSGKADGGWCDGDKLLQCKAGQLSSSKSCEFGCQAMPPGVSDVCKSAPAPAGPCASKPDGAWCDGDNLLQCKGGQTSSSKLCTYGCQAMPPGVADVCKSAPAATGPCAGKGDGAFCDGGDLLQCQGGKLAGSQTCAHGCQIQPAGVADQCKPAPQANGPCTGQVDGPRCEGDALQICKAGQLIGTKACANGCAQSGPGAAVCSEPPFDPLKSCSGKADGAWCSGDKLLTCKAGAVVGAFGCPAGCQAMPAGVSDTCKASGSGPCTGKGDGNWCAGTDLLQCASGQVAKAVSCAKGCGEPAPAAASCKVKGSGFCMGKPAGAYCDGPLLTQCKDSSASSVFACPGGCKTMPAGQADFCLSAQPQSGAAPEPPSGSLKVSDKGGCAAFEGSLDVWGGKGYKVWNQKDFSDPLGTCPGLTIHNSGCTITSLSMLHQVVGVQREVDGKLGNDPQTENAWRKKFGGYAGTSYELGGKKVSGKCLVLWGQAPGGLVPAHGYSAQADCLSTSAGQFIASALKAGMPVVAGVHWAGGNASFYGSKEDWHWVLVVGADSQGVLINDPWGGLERVRLSQGGLGKYVIDDLYVFWQAGAQPAGLAPAPLDDQGEPTTEDLLPKTLTYAEDPPPAGPDTAETPADAGAADGDGQSGFVLPGPATPTSVSPADDQGCSSQPSSGTPATLLLIAAAAWVLGRQRRRQRPGIR